MFICYVFGVFVVSLSVFCRCSFFGGVVFGCLFFLLLMFMFCLTVCFALFRFVRCLFVLYIVFDVIVSGVARICFLWRCSLTD